MLISVSPKWNIRVVSAVFLLFAFSLRKVVFVVFSFSPPCDLLFCVLFLRWRFFRFPTLVSSCSSLWCPIVNVADVGVFLRVSFLSAPLGPSGVHVLFLVG